MNTECVNKQHHRRCRYYISAPNAYFCI